MQNENRYLVGLLIFSFLFYLLASQASPIRWWDETIYLNLGETLSSDAFNYRFTGYGDYNPVEQWYSAGFRPPLLPYLLAAMSILTGTKALLFVAVPLLGAWGIVVIYLLAKEFLGKNALIAAALMGLAPLYVTFSGKVMNDVPATMLMVASILAFWKGFEKGETKWKIAAGVFSALAFLMRYTSGMLIFIFGIYIFVRRRDLLRDKFLYISAGISLLLLSPLFLYSNSEYGTPLGAIMHGIEASTFWGGTQPWHFFLNVIPWFSAVAILGALDMLRHIKDRKAGNKGWLLFIWGAVVLISITLLAHKEERFYLPLLPAFSLLSVASLQRTGKDFRKFALVSVILMIASSLFFVSAEYWNGYIIHGDENSCFSESMNFAKENMRKNLPIYSDQSPQVFFYSGHESPFVPDNLKVPNNSLILWHSGDKTGGFKDMLEESFEKIYACPEGNEMYALFRTRET